MKRANGAGYVTWVGAGTAGFSIDEGARAADAARVVGARGALVDVTRANVIDPVDKLPQMHVYFSNGAAWVDVNDQLPRLGGQTGMEPLKEGE